MNAANKTQTDNDYTMPYNNSQGTHNSTKLEIFDCTYKLQVFIRTVTNGIT